MDGKNAPYVREAYKTATKKEALGKTGKPLKEYIEFLKKHFKAHKQTILKQFSACTADIDAGKITADECYTQAVDKTYENESVYVSPAYRSKSLQKEYEDKYKIKF